MQQQQLFAGLIDSGSQGRFKFADVSRHCVTACTAAQDYNDDDDRWDALMGNLLSVTCCCCDDDEETKMRNSINSSSGTFSVRCFSHLIRRPVSSVYRDTCVDVMRNKH